MSKRPLGINVSFMPSELTRLVSTPYALAQSACNDAARSPLNGRPMDGGVGVCAAARVSNKTAAMVHVPTCTKARSLAFMRRSPRRLSVFICGSLLAVRNDGSRVRLGQRVQLQQHRRAPLDRGADLDADVLGRSRRD